MASIFDFLPPGAREQAGYSGLMQLASGLMQGGAPSTQPGGAMRGLGLGLGGFNQGYQGSINAAAQQGMVAQQMAEAQRKEEQRKAQQAALESLLTPPPVQMAMAGDGRPGPTMAAADRAQAPIAQMFPGQDPNMLRTLAQANPEGFMSAVQSRLMPKERSPVSVAPGASLVDPQTGKAVFANPRSERPTELDRLFSEAGIPEGDPMRAQLAKQILERKGQGQQIKINNIGSIPPGYESFTTPEGATQMRLIPGSPAAKAEAKQGERKEQTGSIVTQDIDRALGIINGKTMLPTTGLMGDWLSKVGGTAANDVRALLDSVRSNAGFKELQAMREASPTGGALGSITERELALLQATVGSLEQNQTKEQLVDNMRRVKNVYLDIIHGQGKGPAREKLKFAEPEKPKEAEADNPYAKMSDQQVLDELRKQGILK